MQTNNPAPMVTYHWVITYADGTKKEADTAYRTPSIAKQAARVSLKNAPDIVNICGYTPTGEKLVEVQR